MSSDEAPRWQGKIDHRLRALWERVPAADRARQRIRVLMRLSRLDDPLSDLGVQVHSVAGDVASGTITLADLPRVANAAEILYVELAQPLTHDE